MRSIEAVRWPVLAEGLDKRVAQRPPLYNPATAFAGLDSMGGWAQLNSR